MNAEIIKHGVDVVVRQGDEIYTIADYFGFSAEGTVSVGDTECEFKVIDGEFVLFSDEYEFIEQALADGNNVFVI